MKIRTFSLGNLNPIELGLVSTLFITGFAGVILLPFYLYLFGAGIFWEYFGVLLCMMLIWSNHSFKLMRYARRDKEIMSLPGYLSSRFGGTTDYIRVFSAMEILILSIVIIAFMLKELGYILVKIYGGNQNIISFIIIMLIAFEVGYFGMRGIAKSAPYKAVVLLLILVILTSYMYFSVGIDQLVKNMMSIDITGSVSDYMNVLYHDGKFLTVQDYISLISMGFLAAGTPFFLSTFFTVKKARYIIRGRRIMMVFVVIEFIAAACFGGITRGYLYPARLTSSLSEYVSLLFDRLKESGSAGNSMAFLLIVLFVIGFLVTIEGTLHLCIVCVYEDILNKGRLVRLNRKKDRINLLVCSIVICIVIFLVNAYIKQLTLNAILVFIATLGCSMAPTVTLSLSWKRMNRYGCMAGLVTGMISVPVFKYATLFVHNEGRASLCDILGVNSVLPSMLITLLVIVLVSLVTPQPEKELIETLDNVRNRISE
ncbi:MAG: hypothetical protein K6E10_09390 [Eubacterium sp.]|nr:hypothetical protein [Eubacterium sp.]